MTPKQIVAALKRKHKTPADAARALGFDARPAALAHDEWSDAARAAALAARKAHAHPGSKEHHGAAAEAHGRAAQEHMNVASSHPSGKHRVAHRDASDKHNLAAHEHGHVYMSGGREDAFKRGTANRMSNAAIKASKAIPRDGDSRLAGDNKERNHMTTVKLSPYGSLLRGALTQYLTPRLAADAKLPDLVGALAGAPTANRVTQRAGIIGALKASTILAADADLEDAVEVLQAIERVIDEEEGEEGDDGMDPNAAIPMTAESEEDDAGEHPVVAKVREFCKGKMSPEDCARLDEMLGEMRSAGDAEQETEEERERREREEEEREAKDNMPKPMTKEAMDAAVKTAVDAAVKLAVDSAVKAAVGVAQAAVEDKHAALAEVRPYVGTLRGAFDSAEAVRRAALKMLRVKDADTIHASALSAVLAAQPRPEATPRPAPVLAGDAAGTPAAEDFFPGAARIRAA